MRVVISRPIGQRPAPRSPGRTSKRLDLGGLVGKMSYEERIFLRESIVKSSHHVIFVDRLVAVGGRLSQQPASEYDIRFRIEGQCVGDGGAGYRIGCRDRARGGTIGHGGDLVLLEQLADSFVVHE